MFSNALIRRYRFSALRPRQLWIYATIYAAIVSILIFINYKGYKYQQLFHTQTEMFRFLFYEFLLLQVLILWIWSASNSASAIKDEIAENSFDFFRMLPMAAYQKTIGILVGKNLLALLLGGVNCLLLLFFGLAGEVNLNLQGQLFAALLSIAILSNSTALISAVCRNKKSKKTNLTFLLFFALFIVPMMINVFIHLGRLKNLEKFRVLFFGLKVPILIMISLIALYFSCWTIAGIIRKFNRENQLLFTKTTAALFLFGYEWIVIGLFFRYFTSSFWSSWEFTRSGINYSCWLILLVPVVLIPFGLLRSFDSYLEYSGHILSKPYGRKRAFWNILGHSNIIAFLLLFAIWIVSVAVTLLVQRGITGLSDSELIRSIYFVFVMLSSYLFFIVILEAYVLYKPVYDKIALLLGFIVLLHMFLPLILSGIFESEIIYLYSPLGFIGGVIFEPEDVALSIAASVIIINALFCVIPAFLIYRRYRFLIAVRQGM